MLPVVAHSWGTTNLETAKPLATPPPSDFATNGAPAHAVDPEATRDSVSLFLGIGTLQFASQCHTQSGDVVDSEQPLYSTGKYIIDDALSSLSKATGSGKIMDNWLRMSTHPSRLAFTNGGLMCLEPVHSECKLGFRDMVFMHALQRF